MTDHKEQNSLAGLHTDEIVRAGLEDLARAATAQSRIEIIACLVLEAFDDYYERSHRIPWLAKSAFEARDWNRAIGLSQERLKNYSVSVTQLADHFSAQLPTSLDAADVWSQVEKLYHELVANRYEADLAVAYLSSLERLLLKSEWRPNGQICMSRLRQKPKFIIRQPVDGPLSAEIVKRILRIVDIKVPFRDLDAQSAAVAARINSELALGETAVASQVEIVKSAFYRNRGAFVIGAIVIGTRRVPLALALLNLEHGLEVDAVILNPNTMSHLFSNTLANFHVAVKEYHDLVDFLYELMPLRPHGQHYSTIGFNHVGKIAVMQQINSDFQDRGELFDHAPGRRGSVAVAFTTKNLPFVLKVIRDEPTDQYKWGAFAGVETVLKKYRQVHDVNRCGSMLDNIIYNNVFLRRDAFSASFLDDLIDAAGQTIQADEDRVGFRHLIVQRRLTPLPIYLENCSAHDAEIVTIGLGQCIRNNAAMNVFNKDFDGRNYGVSTLRFVYLYDYDAVESLTDMKVRTNLDREYGEEDVPDWFFEDGEIFLPEELEVHLNLPDRKLRRLFREAHGELLTVEYWQQLQRRLEERRVPRVRTYPRFTQLNREIGEGGLVWPLSSAEKADYLASLDQMQE